MGYRLIMDVSASVDSWSFEQWWEDLEWKLELEVHQLQQIKIAAAQWLKSVPESPRLKIQAISQHKK